MAVLTPRNDLRWPADMYMEGGDQYRGWFQSSLLVGVGLKGGSPFRECATSGWTLDAEGRAMSKSLNSLGPKRLSKQYGADIFRLWVGIGRFHGRRAHVGCDPKRLSEAYRKLRNTFKYMFGNLADFDPVADAVPGHRLTGIDAWILIRAEELRGVAGRRMKSTPFIRSIALYTISPSAI